MIKKILIIGAGILQKPAILCSKQLGYKVAVVDLDENAPGVKYADVFRKLSTIDVEGVISFAKEYKPDGVMTLATDLPVRTVAAVSMELGLNYFSEEVALKATDKVRMIKCFEKNCIPHPWYEVVSNKEDVVNLLNTRDVPFIIKPNESSGSKGVILVNNKEDIFKAYEYSKNQSKTGIVLIEEYMKGPEVSVETITVNRKTKVIAITDKLTTGSPYFVEMGHSQPSRLDKQIIKQIENIAIKAVEALGIDNSPAHVEIIVTDKGPKLVEIGARLGGDNISTNLVKLSTGLDFLKSTILLAMGEKTNFNINQNRASAIRYIEVPKGKIISIDGIEEIKKIDGINHIEILKKEGDIVDEIKSSSDRIGYIIAQSNTAEEAIKICEYAKRCINIKVQELE